jgi:hypothetical protein
MATTLPWHRGTGSATERSQTWRPAAGDQLHFQVEGLALVDAGVQRIQRLGQRVRRASIEITPAAKAPVSGAMSRMAAASSTA